MKIECIFWGGLNEFEFVTMNSDDFQKCSFNLDRTRKYTVTMDIGSNYTSIVVGDDKIRQPYIIYQIRKNSLDSSTQIFQDNCIQLYHFILNNIGDSLRAVYIESPVYIKGRNNSYATLKGLCNRLSNIASNYLDSHNIIVKPSTTWKSTLFRNSGVKANLRKENKGTVKISVMGLYNDFIVSNRFVTLIQDTYDALGMLVYMYDFLTDDNSLTITPNTPRLKELGIAVVEIVLEKDKDEILNTYKSFGYKIENFSYCYDLDVEENIKSILALTKPEDKTLYIATINNCISVMKLVSNKRNLDEVGSNSKFTVLGGWSI